MAPKITVWYWDVEGAVEPARLCLHCAGMPFEDKRISGEWKDLKTSGKFPFEQLPCIEFDDQIVSQSIPLNIYVAKLTGFYPTDTFAGAKCEEVLAGVQDIRHRLMPSMMEKDEAKKKELRKELAETTLPHWLGLLDRLIEKNGTRGYCVGTKLTVADFTVDGLMRWLTGGVLDDIPTSIGDNFEAIKAVRSAVDGDAKVAEWRAAHQKS